MKATLQIREYDPATDYPMVAGWYEAHGLQPVPPPLLPRLGIVVFELESGRDLAAFWLDMSNSIGVCYLERVVAAPFLSLKQMRAAADFAIRFLKRRAAEMNYAIMLVRVPAPIARVMRRIGFHDSGEVVHCLISSTEEVSDA